MSIYPQTSLSFPPSYSNHSQLLPSSFFHYTFLLLSSSTIFIVHKQSSSSILHRTHYELSNQLLTILARAVLQEHVISSSHSVDLHLANPANLPSYLSLRSLAILTTAFFISSPSILSSSPSVLTLLKASTCKHYSHYHHHPNPCNHWTTHLISFYRSWLFVKSLLQPFHFSNVSDPSSYSNHLRTCDVSLLQESFLLSSSIYLLPPFTSPHDLIIVSIKLSQFTCSITVH